MGCLPSRESLKDEGDGRPGGRGRRSETEERLNSKEKKGGWKRILDRETEDITDVYKLGAVLGRGQFGTTRIAIEKKDKLEFACKSISKKNIQTEDDIQDIKNEIQILSYLKGHPNVCNFQGAFEDRYNIHIVSELCTGGELFERIVERGHFTEKKAADYVRALLGVIQYCQDLSIIHRDLKPENLLLTDKTENADLRLIDFGLATFYEEGKPLSLVAGSSFYIAPEVLKKKYSKEADIWSCGVILYILLSGYPPFYASTDDGVFRAISQGTPNFKSEPWPKVSSQAKDCVKRMLVRDVSKRATAAEILKHEWLKENGVASDKPLNNAVIERLKGFTAMNKLKKEALKVVAENMPKEEIEGMKKAFANIDKDGSKTITIDEFRDMLKTKHAMIPENELKAILEAVDIDGSGEIDYEEFLAGTLNLHSRAWVKDEEQLLNAFKKFDTDGDGAISREELKLALKEHAHVEGDIEQILTDVDTNKDGQIDFKEFRTMILGL